MALEFSQITSITNRHIIPRVVDGIYNSKAFLAYMTQPNRLMMKEGGYEIISPIISSKPSVGGFYDDLDLLSTDRTDNLTASKHQWRSLYEPIRVSRKEMLQNNGKEAILGLIKAKAQIAEKQMKENLALGLFSDGGATTGANDTRQIDGLQAAVDDSSTYGGIAVADLAEWVATVNSNSGTARPLSLNLMQQVYGAASEDNDRPDVATCKQDVYDQVWSLYQPHQRLMSDEMAKLGFSGTLTFNGIPLIVDSHSLSGAIYFLNTNYCKICVHKDENLRKETLEKLETSNSMLMRIFWTGNLVVDNRRFQAVLKDIEVAS